MTDRSPATQERAKSAGIETLLSDEDIVAHADYVLSIVPPRDAVATAKRVEVALSKARGKRGGEGGGENERVLYYLDLNAISPGTARGIDESFRANAPDVRFIDGGIIGGPPAPPPTTTTSDTTKSESSAKTEQEGEEDPASTWTRPGIPLSTPHPLHLSPISGHHLSRTLHTRHLSPTIGTASGLKCCFAALSKGFTALALQSFTTASSLGVLPHLQSYLDEYNPNARVKAERDVVRCTGKAYRWVEEMRQIGSCFGEEGGWGEQARVFREVAGVFEGLAEVVEREGREGMGDVDGVVGVLGEGLKAKERQ